MQVRGWLDNSLCGTATGCHHHLQMHLFGTQCSFKRLKCFYDMCCCSFKMSKALVFAILLVGLALSSTGEPVSHLHFAFERAYLGSLAGLPDEVGSYITTIRDEQHSQYRASQNLLPLSISCQGNADASMASSAEEYHQFEHLSYVCGVRHVQMPGP